MASSNVIVARSLAALLVCAAAGAGCTAPESDIDAQEAAIDGQDDAIDGEEATGSASSALAEVVLDQSNTAAMGVADTFGPSDPMAQTFTAGKTGKLTKIALNAYVCYPSWETTYGLSCWFTLRLKTVTPSGDPGTLIAEVRAREPMPSGSNYNGWTEATFPTPPSITAGTQYAIEIVPDWWMQMSMGDAYTAGQAMNWQTGYNYWARYGSTGWDVLFQTYVEVSSFPEGYIGCYTDSQSRNLPYYMGDGYTAATCKQLAQSYGFRYAGTQYYGQCFIGSSLGAGVKVADSECGAPCNANPGEMCGGAWRNSVYDTQPGAPPPPAAGQYMGCYTDSSTRALPYYMGDGYTKETCVALAQSYGFRYAGTQYYGQCFIGDSVGYTLVSDAECDSPCNANPSQMCGGAWRNSIYATGL